VRSRRDRRRRERLGPALFTTRACVVYFGLGGLALCLQGHPLTRFLRDRRSVRRDGQLRPVTSITRWSSRRCRAAYKRLIVRRLGCRARCDGPRDARRLLRAAELSRRFLGSPILSLKERAHVRVAGVDPRAVRPRPRQGPAYRGPHPVPARTVSEASVPSTGPVRRAAGSDRIAGRRGPRPGAPSAIAAKAPDQSPWRPGGTSRIEGTTGCRTGRPSRQSGPTAGRPRPDAERARRVGDRVVAGHDEVDGPRARRPVDEARSRCRCGPRSWIGEPRGARSAGPGGASNGDQPTPARPPAGRRRRSDRPRVGRLSAPVDRDREPARPGDLRPPVRPAVRVGGQVGVAGMVVRGRCEQPGRLRRFGVGVDRFAVVELRDVGHDPIDPLRPGEDRRRLGRTGEDDPRPGPFSTAAKRTNMRWSPSPGSATRSSVLPAGSLPSQPVRRA